MLVGYVVKLMMVIVLYIYMYRDNKRRDREATANATDALPMGAKIEREAIENGMLDLTELDNRGFRYVL